MIFVTVLLACLTGSYDLHLSEGESPVVADCKSPSPARQSATIATAAGNENYWAAKTSAVDEFANLIERVATRILLLIIFLFGTYKHLVQFIRNHPK
jgi:hypothetical protein